MSNDQALINEASILAERINRARFEGTVPCSFDTVRLCEILDKLTTEH